MKVRYATVNPLLTGALRCVDLALKVLGGSSPKPVPERPTTRILICNQAHLGDAILATAVIPALRMAFPQAQLGFLVHPDSRQVLGPSPDITWVHTVEHWRLNRNGGPWWHRLLQHWRSSRVCAREVQAVGYDLAIDLYHHFPNSIPLLHRSKVARTVGWDSGGFGPWLDMVAHNEGRPIPILHRHARLMRLAGVNVDVATMRPVLELRAEATDRWRTVERLQYIDRPFIAVHVGAHAARRRWPAQRWADAVRELTVRGHRVVLLGHGAAEGEVCRLVNRLNPGAADLSNQLSWNELVAAVAASELLVAHDSAVFHVAAAFDTPRVCVATGIVDLRIWLQASRRSVVLMKPVPCAPCSRTNGCKTMECLLGVATVDLVDAASKLLASTSGRGAAVSTRS